MTSAYYSTSAPTVFSDLSDDACHQVLVRIGFRPTTACIRESYRTRHRWSPQAAAVLRELEDAARHPEPITLRTIADRTGVGLRAVWEIVNRCRSLGLETRGGKYGRIVGGTLMRNPFSYRWTWTPTLVMTEDVRRVAGHVRAALDAGVDLSVIRAVTCKDHRTLVRRLHEAIGRLRARNARQAQPIPGPATEGKHGDPNTKQFPSPACWPNKERGLDNFVTFLSKSQYRDRVREKARKAEPKKNRRNAWTKTAKGRRVSPVELKLLCRGAEAVGETEPRKVLAMLTRAAEMPESPWPRPTLIGWYAEECYGVVQDIDAGRDITNPPALACHRVRLRMAMDPPAYRRWKAMVGVQDDLDEALGQIIETSEGNLPWRGSAAALAGLLERQRGLRRPENDHDWLDFMERIYEAEFGPQETAVKGLTYFRLARNI